jgi:hypothetical protein
VVTEATIPPSRQTDGRVLVRGLLLQRGLTVAPRFARLGLESRGRLLFPVPLPAIQTGKGSRAMPKSKHRRKGGGKSIAHPGRIGGPTPPRPVEEYEELLFDEPAGASPEESVEGQDSMLDTLLPPPAHTKADESQNAPE